MSICSRPWSDAFTVTTCVMEVNSTYRGDQCTLYTLYPIPVSHAFNKHNVMSLTPQTRKIHLKKKENAQQLSASFVSRYTLICSTSVPGDCSSCLVPLEFHKKAGAGAMVGKSQTILRKRNHALCLLAFGVHRHKGRERRTTASDVRPLVKSLLPNQISHVPQT